MKTKIIYISGSEIFNIADIHAAFEEVRNALQLDSDTVLFGVPVDQEDAGLGTTPVEAETNSKVVQDTVIEPNATEESVEIIESVETVIEEIPTEQKPKTKRTRKATKVQEQIDAEPETVESDEPLEKVVPILSVLSGEETTDNSETEETQESEIIKDVVTDEEVIEETKSDDIITEIDENPETENEGEPDLEKLLSAMTPLQEDVLDETVEQTGDDDNDSEDVDATLAQLATEFAETQDKIAAETKSSGRSKIGKLRNILPFKQSKHKDQGLGDLFGWAGVAANDEDFSVPGFFTNASSKK